MKQTVAIIGANSELGQALTLALSGSHYRLVLVDDNMQQSEGLKSIFERIKLHRPLAEIDLVECAHEACWEADIILLALSAREEQLVADRIRDVATQKIVISTSNPSKEIQSLHWELGGESAAELLQSELPNSIIAKAFATNGLEDFGVKFHHSERRECFIAANSYETIKAVKKIVLAAGFTPVVAGNLSASRELEKIESRLVTL